MATATITPTAPAVTVLYDGQCPLCRRSIAVLKRLDWLGRLKYTDARDPAQWPPTAEPLVMQRLLDEMHAVGPDGRRVEHGFKAFRWISWQIPLLMPLAPLFYVPGVPQVGQRVYLWVAKNRFDLVPCHDGACAVPLRPKQKQKN